MLGAASASVYPEWINVGAVVIGFLVGSIWAPWHKESKEVREKAEKLRIESAERNKDVDYRLEKLVTVTERHERAIDRDDGRIARLECRGWRR